MSQLLQLQRNESNGEIQNYGETFSASAVFNTGGCHFSSAACLSAVNRVKGAIRWKMSALPE
jgi:hypothetical protein